MKKATHLLLVIDRSGSMSAVKDEAQAAVNRFLEDQKKVEGECELTLIDFDAGGPDWYRTVYNGPLEGFDTYELDPRGMTALYDAVGRSVTELGRVFAERDEDDRPDNVIVVVQTDGLENSSKEFTANRVKELIAQQTKDYKWSFVFLGMGAETWDTGRAMGIGNNIRATGTAQSYGSTYEVLTAEVTASRVSSSAITGLDEKTE